MSLGGRFNGTLNTPPGHDNCFRRQIAFQDLIPANHTAAMGFQKGLKSFYIVILQGLVGVYLQLFHAFTDTVGCLPLFGHHLITTQVDKLSGKHFHDLTQDRFQERQSGFLEIEYVVVYPPTGRHLL